MLIMETLLCTRNKNQHLFTDVFSGLNILLKIHFIFLRPKITLALCLDLLDIWACLIVNAAKFRIEFLSSHPDFEYLFFPLHPINYGHELTEWVSDNTCHFMF